MQYAGHVLNLSGQRISCSPGVLIVTDVYDHECDKIGRLLLENGIEYARINAKYIPEKFSLDLSVTCDSATCRLQSGSQMIDCSMVRVVILRNFNIDCSAGHVYSVANAIYRQEWQASIYSLLNMLDAVIINDPIQEQRLESPSHQLMLAARHGFSIPGSLISSDVGSIFSFIGGHPEKFIIKSIGLHHTILDGVRYSYFARKVSDVLESLANGTSTPVLIQELIPKNADLRVTFIGEELFFTKIERPAHLKECIDYHHFRLDELIYSEFEAELSFEKKCRSFISSTGLFYGSIDFVCVSETDLTFLEVNCSADWHWLERTHARSISVAFVEAIINILRCQS